MPIHSTFKSRDEKFDIKLEYSNNKPSAIYFTSYEAFNIYDIATAIFETYSESFDFEGKITCIIKDAAHGEDRDIEISKKDCFEDALVEVAKEIYI